MKTGILVVPALLSVCLSYPVQGAENINYSKVHWSGVSAHVVTINLNSPDLKVTVSLAKRGRGSAESFSSMVNRVKPAAAITGTFFCTRSLLPTGDIVIEGKSVHTGSVGTGVCITPDNKVEFVPYAIGHRNKWQGYETVLCAGPTLVKNGQQWLMPRDQGFRDPSLFGRKRRTGVAVTNSNKLLFVTVDAPVQLRTLAQVMIHLGARDAVALDGGSSTALHCDGKTVSRPGRTLTNLLVAYDSLSEYNLHREALAPALRGTYLASTPKPAISKVSYAAQPAAESRLPEYMSLVTGYRIGSPEILDRAFFANPDGRTTGSDQTEPVVPDTETAMTIGKVETSLTMLSARPARKAHREHGLLMSSRLLTQ